MNTAIFPLSVKLPVLLNLIKSTCSRKEDILESRLSVPMKLKLPIFPKSYEVLLLPAKYRFRVQGT